MFNDNRFDWRPLLTRPLFFSLFPFLTKIKILNNDVYHELHFGVEKSSVEEILFRLFFSLLLSLEGMNSSYKFIIKFVKMIIKISSKSIYPFNKSIYVCKLFILRI
jgi:hypothetical protein